MLLNPLPLDLLPARAVPLAGGVVLISLPAGNGTKLCMPFGSRPPFGTVEVQSASGTTHIAAMRLPEECNAEADLGEATAFPLPPVLLDADVADLAAELDPASRLRLLSFLLGFCRKAFDLATDPDFIAACQNVARVALPEGGLVEPVATVTQGWILLSGLNAGSDASIWTLAPKRIRRNTVLHVPGSGALCIVERLSPGDLVIVLGEQHGIFTVGPVRANFCDLLRPQAGAEVLRAACLRVLAPVCPIVAASLRELALLSPAAPIRHHDMRRPIAGALEAAIPDGDGKLFLRGWLHDPHRLVASADLCGLGAHTKVELADLFRFERPDLESKPATATSSQAGAPVGFVAYLDDPAGGLTLQPTLVLRLHSGARLPLRPPLHMLKSAEARSAVLTSVPPNSVSDTMLDSCIGPAAATFHRQSLRDRGTPEVIQIGRPIAEPHTSIVVPLYRNLDFLRFQVAAFASDPSCRDAELIYVLDSPEQRVEVEHLLRGLHAMHALSVKLVVLTRNLGYAAASNAGATVARAPALLLLNSDIVPEQPNWLADLHAALADPLVGAAGPKLLFDDESIQHAGLYFLRDADGVWLNAHFHKGMPRSWPAACESREVPGLTGAAILVRRSLFEAVGGICEDYIIGDYEDSDFCLRLRKARYKTVYVPSAELFHFERRSIALHRGYSGTLACRYNRQLHHCRWDSFIAGLSTDYAEMQHRLSEVA